jgi:GntR family transcriptional regulator
VLVWAFPLIEDLFGVKVAEVLVVQRTYRLSNRQLAQVTVSTHPAARYRHSMTLRRVKQ